MTSARNGQDRIAIQEGGPDAEDQVAGARTQGRDAHPGDPGKASHCSRHERRRGFVAGQDEPDARAFQRVDQFQHLAAGMAEGEADAGVMQGARHDRRAGVVLGQSDILVGGS